MNKQHENQEHQPSSEPELQSENEQHSPEEAGNQVEMSANFEGGTQIGGDVNISFSNERPQELKKRILSPGQFQKRFNLASLEKRIDDLYFEEKVRDRLVEKLQEKRFVILTGPTRFGKAEAVFPAAYRLMQKESRFSEILFLSKPDQGLKIDLRKIAKDQDHFGSRMILLKNAFSLQNPSLKRFLDNADMEAIEEIAHSLEQNNAFIVLTTDAQFLVKNTELSQANIILTLPKTSPSFLLDIFVQRLTPIRESLDKVQAEQLAPIEDTAETICTRLETIPKIISFLDDQLQQVLRGERSLEQALNRTERLQDWLSDQLTEDFETWCFALALITCHASTVVVLVPWLQFHKMWRFLYAKMRRELRVSSPRTPRNLANDHTLLHKLHAGTQTYNMGAHYVQFDDPDYAGRLWRVLADRGLNLLCTLVPWLTEATKTDDRLLQVAAARALGRIGAIDPHGITYPVMNALFNEEPDQNMSGYLFQGMIGGGDKEYLATSIRVLRGRALSADPGPAILSIREIGAVDLKRGMAMLEQILQTRFREKIRNLHGAEKMMRDLEENYAKFITGGRASKVTHQSHLQNMKWLTDVILLGNEADTKALFAIFYSLVGLCFIHGPSNILAYLNQWLRKDPEVMGPMVGLFFVAQQGLTLLIGKFKVDIPADPEKKERQVYVDRILRDLYLEDDAAGIMAFFFSRVYRGFGIFPATIAKDMYALLSSRLTDLVHQSLKYPRCRPSMESLLVDLLDRPEQGFSEFIDRILIDFRTGDLKEFRINVKKKFFALQNA